MTLLIVIIASWIVGTVAAIGTKVNQQISAHRYNTECIEAYNVQEESENNTRAETLTELQRQLESVQYQLSLVTQLDDYINHASTDEKDLKKALALEKQHAALYAKERKLKQQIHNLEKL